MKQTALLFKLSLVTLILVPMLIWASYAALFNRMVSYIAYPLVRLQPVLASPFTTVTRYLTTHNELSRQLEHLNTRYRALQAEHIALNAQKEFYQDIREVVDFNKRYLEEKGTLAHVLLKEFSPSAQSYLINYGSSRGAQEGMVVVYKNCLIGRIETVYPFFSKVVLITDSRCKVACYCRGSKARGIHEGVNRGAQGRIQYINHLHEVVPGQLVISSGQGVVFPQGFGVARVMKAEKNELTWQVETVPLVDLETIEYCLVLPKEV
jgi:rod shape-determining protein MreC